MIKLDSSKTQAFMKRQELSASELARRAYLPPETVRRALDGKFVNAIDAYKIADVLDAKIEELQAGIRHFDRELEGVNSAITTVTEALVALSSNKDAARSFCKDLLILGALKGAAQRD